MKNDDLALGDYDGDTAIAIWQPEIVNSFHPAPNQNSFADPPPNLADNFVKSIETVADVLNKCVDDSKRLQSELQRHILAPLEETSAVGIYSNMHVSARVIVDDL